jgi:TfoX/Sxy family transcriptional regulator of competence genes
VAYDEKLADRVRDILAGDPALSERKMFGGLAFMLDGNMCCGIVDDRLMLRLGADLAEQALERTHVHPMDFTGRPMTGMVYVAPEGARGEALRCWVEQAADFARTLPPKRASRGAPDLG